MRDGDLHTLARWETDPGRLALSANWVLPTSEATARQRQAGWGANERDDVGFAIETVEDPSVLVGSVGLWGARPKNRCAAVAISLGREHLGRGYGTEAMSVLVGYGFREMGLHRIQLEVWSFNHAAMRSYAKVGFVEQGRRRSRIWHDGRWYDEVLMGILEDEWDAGRR